MIKGYPTAVLLIEFDGDKTFALTGQSELAVELDNRSPQARLVLLLLHFPKLRCVLRLACMHACLHALLQDVDVHDPCMRSRPCRPGCLAVLHSCGEGRRAVLSRVPERLCVCFRVSQLLPCCVLYGQRPTAPTPRHQRCCMTATRGKGAPHATRSHLPGAYV